MLGAKASLLLRLIVATAVIPFPAIIFEKITYHYYAIASPLFFTLSGYRLWVDIIWFCVAGVVAAVLVGRKTKLVIVPPLTGSLIFTIVMYVAPLCTVKECYISSTDGLAPIRDFLLFGSLAVITSASCMTTWSRETMSRLDIAFQLGVTALVGFALSFFPVMHIFAGVSAPYPINYLQWFLAGAPAGLAGSMWMLDRGNMRGFASKLFAGLAGVSLAIALGVDLPCEDCSGYSTSIASILLLALALCVPAILLEIRQHRAALMPKTLAEGKAPVIVTATTIAVAITLMLSLFFTGSYQMSVVNGFYGVTNTVFSPLEVGSTFVYSAGYLAIPRVVSQSVGVNVSFGNTTLSQTQDPSNFLATGVGDQSPNCCKDGLDLAYRADVIEFTNGTEAVLARAWWACDVIVACGGYSWQQLLHFGSLNLPAGTLSNWVELQMNWTSSTLIQWFYRIHYVNSTTGPWILYSSFVPPTIQNHYWDAGLFETGNRPLGYAFFYQFGVSSAYPIQNGAWQVFVQCPNIVLNGTRSCISAASYVNGLHSFWKSIYTFGETYRGMTFSYLGNFEVKFYYSGHSPADETVIWK